MKLKLEIHDTNITEMRTLLRNLASDIGRQRGVNHYDYITDDNPLYDRLIKSNPQLNGNVGIVAGFAKGVSDGDLIAHYVVK
tara:strand:+ start:663 stop:908 length:246 start_codon:yes stop_codon:yes gene_type:complete